MRLLKVAVVLSIVAPEHVSLAESVDCKTVVTEGYNAILTRPPDDGGLKDKVESCEKQTPWPASAGPMRGRPWTPAGMVYEMRNSEEYQTGKKLSPDKEKGGCRFCKLTTKGIGGVYCTASALPPDDSITLDCVLQSSATECCEPPEFGWGWTFLLLIAVSSGLYAGGGIAYNVKTNGATPGLEALPHMEQWQNIHALVQDGIAFSKRRVLQSRAAGIIARLTGHRLGGAGAYSPLPKAAAPTPDLATAGAPSGGSGESLGAGGKTQDWASATGDEKDMFGDGNSSSSGSGSGSDTDDEIIE